jgi:hypothetical protein
MPKAAFRVAAIPALVSLRSLELQGVRHGLEWGSAALGPVGLSQGPGKQAGPMGSGP